MVVQRRRQKTRRGTRSYRKRIPGKKTRAVKGSRRLKAKARATRGIGRGRGGERRAQSGGAAHIPDDRFPEDSVVIVRDADGDEGPFLAVSLKEAKKELIAESDRPADPYDTETPGTEPE